MNNKNTSLQEFNQKSYAVALSEVDEVLGITQDDLGEIMEWAQPRSKYLIEKHIVGQHDTAPAQYLQILLELGAKRYGLIQTRALMIDEGVQADEMRDRAQFYERWARWLPGYFGRALSRLAVRAYAKAEDFEALRFDRIRGVIGRAKEIKVLKNLKERYEGQINYADFETDEIRRWALRVSRQIYEKVAARNIGAPEASGDISLMLDFTSELFQERATLPNELPAFLPLAGVEVVDRYLADIAKDESMKDYRDVFQSISVAMKQQIKATEIERSRLQELAAQEIELQEEAKKIAANGSSKKAV